jgi:hypothetical protein
MLGEEIVELLNGFFEVGIHKVDWNAVDFTSGIYLYQLQANDFIETKRMILLK